jgi:hypothetical protein
MTMQMKGICLIIGVLFLSINIVRAVELRQLPGEKIITPDQTSETIKIDGELSESIWANAPISEEFITYNPLYGQALEHKTKLWLAYDSQNLYFAFKCYDPEPDKIKTAITQRDNILNDDWVGVLIDSMGNKQSSYEFYVNPSGIQGDYLNYGISVEPDIAPDFIWESAGKITGEGYNIEIRIPLETLRFKSGEEVHMGVLFLRNITRFGIAGTWPETEPGQTDFNFMATAVYRGLKGKLNLQVLPNFTYSRDVERESADEWGKSDTSKNIGAAIKYGITSATTVEATVNPDFSQVESDAFQAEVNRRYPIFYSEKRPFFMEGMDQFDFGTIFQGQMISTVHTRRIVDPGWAAKLSGSAGKMNFAFLTANDRAPGRAWEGDINPDEGRDVFWGIARAKYNFSSDNHLGILYSGRHFAGNKNDVLGADLRCRFFKNARLSLSYLYSRTKEPDNETIKNGDGVIGMFQYFIPTFTLWATYERYDKNFTMESAFMNRTDISQGQVLVGPNFELKGKGTKWLKRIQPFVHYLRLHDFDTGMDDTFRSVGFFAWFFRWGILRMSYQNEKEAWLGQLFNKNYFYSWGNIQLLKWLFVEGEYQYGDKIYYDVQEPFLGSGHYFNFKFILQPNIRTAVNFDFIHDDLYRKTDHQRFYSVDILNLQVNYQFNRYFFIRGALRYDSFQDKLLTDFLASFTLIPGTVLHLGYGSLYEKRDWLDNRWIPGQGNFRNMKNALFLKVSYLWQIK